MRTGHSLKDVDMSSEHAATAEAREEAVLRWELWCHTRSRDAMLGRR